MLQNETFQTSFYSFIGNLTAENLFPLVPLTTSRDEDPIFFSLVPDPAELRKNSDLDPTLIRNEKKIYLYFRYVGIKFNLINHHFKLEFVDSGLYFVPR